MAIYHGQARPRLGSVCAGNLVPAPAPPSFELYLLGALYEVRTIIYRYSRIVSLVTSIYNLNIYFATTRCD